MAALPPTPNSTGNALHDLWYNYPVTSPTPLTGAGITELDYLDTFLSWQMDQFKLTGPRLAKTFKTSAPQWFSQGDNNVNTLFFRADIYDNSVAAIYFLQRKNYARAKDLIDGLYRVLIHDNIGDGRMIAAIYANNALTAYGDPGAVTPPIDQTNTINDGTIMVGNMAWAALAFMRYYHSQGGYQYLEAAAFIGDWIVTEMQAADSLGGFYGGYQADGTTKNTWRATEHNTDCYAMFTNLANLTNDPSWTTHATNAQKFVKACWQTNHYVTGTVAGSTTLNTLVPADCQTWTTLSGVDPANDETALNWLISNLLITTNTGNGNYKGVKFTDQGENIQNEETAGTAMAMTLNSNLNASFGTTATDLFASLKSQRETAPSTDYHGLVATPAPAATTGLNYNYFNWGHCASTAWTGLAILSKTDPTANPYAVLS